MLCNSIFQSLRQCRLRRSRKVIGKEEKMYHKRATVPKVMTFRSFQISMRILCSSSQLGCSISLQLLGDLAKMYENESSQCSNDQIIKNLQLLDVRKLLMQCYATQYSKAFGSVGYVDLEKLQGLKKKSIPNERPSQKL